MTVHMTEAELARDLHRVLEKVRQGVEVVIEEDHRPVAVIKEPLLRGHASGAGAQARKRCQNSLLTAASSGSALPPIRVLCV